MAQANLEQHISKGTPFLGIKFLIVCIVFINFRFCIGCFF